MDGDYIVVGDGVVLIVIEYRVYMDVEQMLMVYIEYIRGDNGFLFRFFDIGVDWYG